MSLPVAIAARAQFEGVRPIMLGGSNIEGESLACQLHFQSTPETEKNASAQGS